MKLALIICLSITLFVSIAFAQQIYYPVTNSTTPPSTVTIGNIPAAQLLFFGFGTGSAGTTCTTGFVFDWSDSTGCQAITAVIR